MLIKNGVIKIQIYYGSQNQVVSENNPFPIKSVAGADDIGQVLNGYKEETVLISASRTISGESEVILSGKYKEAVAFIDVTAATGTSPTLDVKFQTKDPVSGKWFNITELEFTQLTIVGNEMKTKSGLLGSSLKCIYTIGGTTPDFTFSIGLILKS